MKKFGFGYAIPIAVYVTAVVEKVIFEKTFVLKADSFIQLDSGDVGGFCVEINAGQCQTCESVLRKLQEYAIIKL